MLPFYTSNVMRNLSRTDKNRLLFVHLCNNFIRLNCSLWWLYIESMDVLIQHDIIYTLMDRRVISRGICTAVKGWQEWRRSWPRPRSNPLHTDKRIVITPTTLITKLLKAIKRSTRVSYKAFRMINMILLVSSCSALQKREAREVWSPLWCVSGSVHW